MEWRAVVKPTEERKRAHIESFGMVFVGYRIQTTTTPLCLCFFIQIRIYGKD